MAGHANTRSDAHGSDSHHDAHSSGGGMEWLAQNMSGIIMPFGQKAEKFAERMMFFLVNDFFRRAAVIYMVVFTPLIAFEFLLKFVRL